MKVLYFVSVDWYFISHRFDLAKEMVRQGNEVVLVTSLGAYRQVLESAGIKVIDFNVGRSNFNIFNDVRLFCQLVKIYRSEMPDLVHHVAMKPVLYGSLAARFAGVSSVVNALGGLGFVFSSDSLRAKIYRVLLVTFLRLSLRRGHSHFIFQNQENIDLFLKAKILSAAQISLQRGAGVCLSHFNVTPESGGTPLVILASRMIWDKGIAEFVKAARIVRELGFSVDFKLYGRVDLENPNSIPEKQLHAWTSEGVVTWGGESKNINNLFARSAIVCLPTFYGEGVPKVLIEAASCGRPIITTDTPGCNDIVHDGDNGILIEPKSVQSLVDALIVLLESAELRQSMGCNGRKRVESGFSMHEIIAETSDIYSRLIEEKS